MDEPGPADITSREGPIAVGMQETEIHEAGDLRRLDPSSISDVLFREPRHDRQGSAFTGSDSNVVRPQPETIPIERARAHFPVTLHRIHRRIRVEAATRARRVEIAKHRRVGVGGGRPRPSPPTRRSKDLRPMFEGAPDVNLCEGAAGARNGARSDSAAGWRRGVRWASAVPRLRHEQPVPSGPALDLDRPVTAADRTAGWLCLRCLLSALD